MDLLKSTDEIKNVDASVNSAISFLFLAYGYWLDGHEDSAREILAKGAGLDGLNQDEELKHLSAITHSKMRVTEITSGDRLPAS